MTFSFVPGRFHGPECWDLVCDAFRKKGVSTITPEFPIEDPDISLNDHAEILALAEEGCGEREFIRVGWSWGTNVVLREVNDSTKKVIIISGGFHPSTLKNHPGVDSLREVEHGLMYEIYQDLSRQKRQSFAEQLFYHDVKDAEIRQKAISALREHPYRDTEPELKTFPAVPLGYIALTRDRVNTIQYQRETAHLLGVKETSMYSGHAPMYARYKSLADRLIQIALADNKPAEETANVG